MLLMTFSQPLHLLARNAPIILLHIKLCVDNEKTERLPSTSKDDDDWIQLEDDTYETLMSYHKSTSNKFKTNL